MQRGRWEADCQKFESQALTLCHNAMILRNEKEIEQQLTLESGSEKSISSYSDCGHNEDSATADCDNNASGIQVHVWSTP
jgi:hypothetical protein